MRHQSLIVRHLFVRLGRSRSSDARRLPSKTGKTWRFEYKKRRSMRKETDLLNTPARRRRIATMTTAAGQNNNNDDDDDDNNNNDEAMTTTTSRRRRRGLLVPFACIRVSFFPLSSASSSSSSSSSMSSMSSSMSPSSSAALESKTHDEDEAPGFLRRSLSFL